MVSLHLFLDYIHARALLCREIKRKLWALDCIPEMGEAGLGVIRIAYNLALLHKTKRDRGTELRLGGAFFLSVCMIDIGALRDSHRHRV